MRASARASTTALSARVAIARLMKEAHDGAVVVANGRTLDNAGALPDPYYDAMLAQYGASALGRQELDRIDGQAVLREDTAEHLDQR